MAWNCCAAGLSVALIGWRFGSGTTSGALRSGGAPQLRHPVVLAHGFLGFDEVMVAGVRHEYFRDLTRSLAKHSHAIHRPRVAPTGSVASRAKELANCIRPLTDRRVNVIAHSMGGQTPGTRSPGSDWPTASPRSPLSALLTSVRCSPISAFMSLPRPTGLAAKRGRGAFP